jgi:uncharacterized protein (DUF2062 family)
MFINIPFLNGFLPQLIKGLIFGLSKEMPLNPPFFGVWWFLSLPLVGFQMLIVFFLALLVRANLPLIVALQWISNPFTMGPIYFADYKIGRILLELAGYKVKKNPLLSPDYDWAHFKFKDLLELLDTFPPMFLGGSVLGVFFGVVSVFFYKMLAKSFQSPQINSKL